MAKILPPGTNVNLGFSDRESPFDKLMKLVQAGTNVWSNVNAARQRQEANNVSALNTADNLLRNASTPAQVQQIENTLGSVLDPNYVSDNPNYNLLSEYIGNTIEERKQGYKDFEKDAGNLMSRLYSSNNQFGKSILDLNPTEFKKHIDNEGGKTGWAPQAMLERTNTLLPMIERFQTLYKGKNPNQKIKYTADGASSEITIGNFMNTLRKYEDMIESTVMEAMSEATISPGTNSRLSIEEATQILQITGEAGNFDSSWFKDYKTQQLGLFRSMYDTSSKNLNTYLNSMSKILDDAGEGWGTQLDPEVLAKNPENQRMMEAIVSDPDFANSYASETQIGDEERLNNLSAKERLALISQDIINGRIDKDGVSLIFQQLGMTANDRRTMAINGLRAWGGSNYFEYVSPPAAIGDDPAYSNLGDDDLRGDDGSDVDYGTKVSEGEPYATDLDRDTFVDEATDERLAAIETKTAPVREEITTPPLGESIDAVWNELSPDQKKYLHENWDINNLNDFKTYTGDDVSTLPELSIPGLEGEPPVSEEVTEKNIEKIEGTDDKPLRTYMWNGEENNAIVQEWDRMSDAEKQYLSNNHDVQDVNDLYELTDGDFGSVPKIPEDIVAEGRASQEVKALSTDQAGESIYTFENAIIATGVGVTAASIPKVREVTKTSIKYLAEAANMPDEDIVRMLKRADVQKASQEITGYLDRVRSMNVEFLETYGKNMDPNKLATYKKHHDKMKVVNGQVMVWDGKKHVLPEWLKEKKVYTKKGVMTHVTGDPNIKKRIFGNLNYDEAVSKFKQRKNVLKNYQASVKGNISILRANGFFDEFPDMDEQKLTKILRNSDKWNFWKVKDIIRTTGREIWRTPKDLLKTLGKASVTIGPLEGAMLGWYAGEQWDLGWKGKTASAVLGTASMKVVIDQVIKRGGWEAVKNPLLTSKIFNIARQKAPWLMAKIATKTAVGGTAASTGLGTPLAIAMGVWTAKDIAELVKLAPEIKDELIKYLNSEGEYAPESEKEEKGAVAAPPSS
jgi:hypothetical protein